MIKSTRPLTGGIVLVAMLFMAGCEPAQEAAAPDPGPRPAVVVEVSAAASAIEYSYPAIVLPAAEAELSFKVAGQIIELPVRAMSDVKRGDLIARIDKRDFESNVDQIQAQLDAANAQLRQMLSGARAEDIGVIQASIDAANAQVEQARVQARQTLTQYRKGLEPKSRMDADMAALEAAEAQLRSAEQELTKGRAGGRSEEVAAQRAQIAGLEAQMRAAEDTRSDATLVAPFDGVLAERTVENFANVSAGQTIAVVQNLATLELSFDVPGPDVSRLGTRQGQLRTVVFLDALPGREFSAKVVEFTTRADPGTQTFRGRVSIERPDDAIVLPGMAGRVVVFDSIGRDGELSIPTTALAAAPDGAPFVWVVDEANTVSTRDVETSEVLGGSVVIHAGLEEGDRIVTAGLSALQPGMEVRPIASVGD